MAADSINPYNPDPNDDENIVWRKFFEDYNSVTALKLARSDTFVTTDPVWQVGGSCAGLGVADCYDKVPEKVSIYRDYVAAFLQSRCTMVHPHKIILLAYDGEIVFTAPYKNVAPSTTAQ